MKRSIVFLSLLALGWSCQQKAKVAQPQEKFASFGAKISKDSAISKEELFAKYAALNEGDTVNVKFISKINEVCQKKGCWMQLELPEENSAFVKFKDYGFFMPLNSAKSNVIVNGKAFVSVESVDELRHYAKDAGKSQAAIDSIVDPETTYSFLADGVLLQK